MKKIISIFCAVIILFISFACSDSGKWVAKIDSDVISLDELNTYYYAQHKHLLNITSEEIDKYSADPEKLKILPTLDKKVFLEEMIKQRLIYNKAVDEGVLDNKEVKAVIQIAKEGAVVQAYVKEKFKKETNPGADEIEKAYAAERTTRYAGVPIEQAERDVKQRLMMKNLQKKLGEMIEYLKEEKKIKRNLDLLNSEAGKKGVDAGKAADPNKK